MCPCLCLMLLMLLVIWSFFQLTKPICPHKLKYTHTHTANVQSTCFNSFSIFYKQLYGLCVCMYLSFCVCVYHYSNKHFQLMCIHQAFNLFITELAWTIGFYWLYFLTWNDMTQIVSFCMCLQSGTKPHSKWNSFHIFIIIIIIAITI